MRAERSKPAIVPLAARAAAAQIRRRGRADETAGGLYHGEPAQRDALYRRDLDLPARVFQHREGLTPGFASRYGCRMLVYYVFHEDMNSAIAREKAIKGGSRRKKLLMIERFNPEWRDLYADFA